jgi:hypothetical protein
MPSEKELDRALALELETNPEFLSWLISHTKFAGTDVKFHSCRADHPWGSHPFTSSDLAADRATTVTRQSETDVLLVVSDGKGRRFGIHIENKISSGRFTNLQPEMYAQRARHWIGSPRHGSYVDFDTILSAPEAFRQRNAEQADLFGAFVSHESIAEHIPLFRA